MDAIPRKLTMPCSKYKGKQRRACYATDEWRKKVRPSARKLIKRANKKKRSK